MEINMIKKGKGRKHEVWLFSSSPNHRKTCKTVPTALLREQRWERSVYILLVRSLTT